MAELAKMNNTAEAYNRVFDGGTSSLMSSLQLLRQSHKMRKEEAGHLYQSLEACLHCQGRSRDRGRVPCP